MTVVGRRLLDWPGDPRGWADGVPLRICGGLHALVRSGGAPAVAACYPPNPAPDADTLWRAIAPLLDDARLDAWLDRTPQTNEVGRGAALMAGLLAVAAETRLPIALFELGASAGRTLRLHPSGFDRGGGAAGDARSPLTRAPEWRGPPPPDATVTIASARGGDLDPGDPVRDRARLLAYVWADQARRMAQLDAALDVAATAPVPVERDDAADWVERRFPVDPTPGVARVIQHSVAWQYFPPDTQARIARRIVEAGAAATADAPVGWLRFEKEPGDRQTNLRLRLWPGGAERLLATCHAHGAWVDWRGEP